MGWAAHVQKDTALAHEIVGREDVVVPNLQARSREKMEYGGAMRSAADIISDGAQTRSSAHAPACARGAMPLSRPRAWRVSLGVLRGSFRSNADRQLNDPRPFFARQCVSVSSIHRCTRWPASPSCVGGVPSRIIRTYMSDMPVMLCFGRGMSLVPQMTTCITNFSGGGSRTSSTFTSSDGCVAGTRYGEALGTGASCHGTGKVATPRQLILF